MYYSVLRLTRSVIFAFVKNKHTKMANNRQSPYEQKKSERETTCRYIITLFYIFKYHSAIGNQTTLYRQNFGYIVYTVYALNK